MELLQKYDLTYPTILKAADELMRRNILAKADSGQHHLLAPYDAYSKHVQAFKFEFPALKPAKSSNATLERDIRRLVAYYGSRFLGVSNSMPHWFRQNIQKLHAPVKSLLSYGKGYDGAVEILNRAAAYFKTQELQWSLQGAVLSQIHRFLPDSKLPAPVVVKDADKLIKAYKMLKGMDDKNQFWDKKHGRRAIEDAAEILRQFEGHWRDAVTYMEAEVKYLQGQGLSWNFDTLVNRVPDYRLREKERKIKNDQRHI